MRKTPPSHKESTNQLRDHYYREGEAYIKLAQNIPFSPGEHIERLKHWINAYYACDNAFNYAQTATYKDLQQKEYFIQLNEKKRTFCEEGLYKCLTKICTSKLIPISTLKDIPNIPASVIKRVIISIAEASAQTSLGDYSRLRDLRNTEGALYIYLTNLPSSLTEHLQQWTKAFHAYHQACQYAQAIIDTSRNQPEEHFLYQNQDQRNFCRQQLRSRLEKISPSSDIIFPTLQNLIPLSKLNVDLREDLVSLCKRNSYTYAKEQTHYTTPFGKIFTPATEV